MYFLAVVLPPIAVLMAGKPIQAFLNLILTLFLWLPGAIHAVMVVNDFKADERAKRLVNRV